MSPSDPNAPPAKFAPAARCSCARRPTMALRVFTETVRLLRERLGALPPEILALPIVDVRCRESGCKHNVALRVGDLLGYDREAQG